MSLRAGPEQLDQLRDGEHGLGGWPGQTPTVSVSFGDDAGVLRAALASPMLAQEYVAATAQAISQGNDALPGVLVKMVGGDVARHAVDPFAEDLRAVQGFLAALSDVDRYT
jgi:hypothetical protein